VVAFGLKNSEDKPRYYKEDRLTGESLVRLMRKLEKRYRRCEKSLRNYYFLNLEKVRKKV
jgi:hypothetical protein